MAQEKAFEATQSRLDQARREGDLPRSAEIVTAAALGGAALSLLPALPVIGEGARAALVRAARGTVDGHSLAILCAAALVPMLGGLAAAFVASLVQTKGITFRLPRFAPSKLNPVEGCKRMFSRGALLAAVKACVATVVLTAAIVPAVRDVFGASVEFTQLVPLVLRSLEIIAATSVAVGLAFGLLDLLLEQNKWRKRLRMSLDELKRDVKQSEGDPHLRNKRKQAHRALVRGSLTRLADAAFVVTNPTHIAIALEYRPPEIEVPRVLIRAVDEGAQLVRKRARELGLPLIENVPLARTLLATAEVDAPIPRESYVAVAQIVAALLRSRAIA